MAPATENAPDLNQKIAIVGAGVFGLSTSLHLAKRGYRNIHLFDYQPYHLNNYACSSGCDAASCDENKILRASYGNAKLYQDMAFKAMPVWREWNDLLSKTSAEELPSGLSPDIKLWYNCGYLRLSDNGLEQSETETQNSFPEEIKGTQYRVSDWRRREDAKRDGIPFEKIDPFGRLERGLDVDGVLDMTGGFVLASRACAFALWICRGLGVSVHLGEGCGLQRLVKDGERVTGIITKDGTKHDADIVIIACGGWTPSLIPEVERLIETTAGSVLAIQLPEHRQDLWDKYSPGNFPVWGWNMNSYNTPGKDIGGIYGLPRTPEGLIKIAFRGAKWTNYARTSETGRQISYPKTDVQKVPQEAMRVLKTFCSENMPDLLDLDLESPRLCWYSDSVDNSFVIDYAPGYDNLIVANGGSGHGFKFLPVLGEHVVDVVEMRDTEYTRLFKWRDVPDGARNGLEDGTEGWRTLDKQKMVGKEKWKPDARL